MDHKLALKEYPDYRAAWEIVDKTIRSRYRCPYKTLRSGRLIFESSPGKFDFIRMHAYDHSPEHGAICRITNRCPPKTGWTSWREDNIKRDLAIAINRNRTPGTSGFEISFLPSEAAEIIEWILESLDGMTENPNLLRNEYSDAIKKSAPLRDDGYLWTKTGREVCKKIQHPRFSKR